MEQDNLLKERHTKLLEEERRILKEIHEAAESFDRNSEITQQARTILDHLDELFLIVVVGEVKSGKSYFINSLVGKRICPEGPIPVTDRINILHYGSEERERIIEDFVVERTFPLDVLRNLSIVDTPGTNSIIRRHQEITERFIPRADLILFVTCIDRPFTETEHRFLSYISRQWRKKIVVILTKVDTRTPEEISLVKEYIAKNVREKLGIDPLIFPVSARDGLDAREKQGGTDAALFESSNMGEVERYTRETLSDTEKLKLKLASPVDSGLAVIDSLDKLLNDRGRLLEADFKTLDLLDAQVSQSCKELNERCYKYITDIYDLLREFERRGMNFLEEKIALKSANLIRDAEKFKQLFEKEVVADLKESVEDVMNSGVDWLMRENIAMYEKSVKFLTERVETGKYKDDVVGGGGQSPFEYNRERIFNAIKDGYKRHINEFDVKGECNRVVDSSYRGLLGFLGMEIGAVGLGVLAASIFSAVWLDVTGILFAGAVALTGFFILPAKKRQAIKEFRTKVEALITQFKKTLSGEFGKEIDAVLDNIRSIYNPFLTFYKAETEKIKERNEKLSGCKTGLLALKSEIEALSEPGLKKEE